jgi:hypothetical protein
VTPAPLTVSADSQTRIYGATNPVFTASYAGLVNGDTTSSLSGALTVSTVADTNSPVGAYPIVASGLNSGNYAITFANGTLTVTAAPLLVSADNASRLYGAANPSFSASVTGLVNGDATNVLAGALVFNTSATTNSPVGTYPIAVSGVMASNYDISFTNGTLTVTAYALSVVADNQSRGYGNANPALTGTLSGVQNGDNITASYATIADAASNVGTYAITASLNDPDGRLVNYTVSNTPGALTVTAAALSVSADNQSKVYGAANPALTGTITGLVNSDNITASYATVADAGSSVRTYPITVTLNDPASKLGNYAVTSTAGTLTITTAPLSVAVDNQSKVYGSANPALTGTLTGLVNSDNITASYATTATTGSAAGNYAITASLNDPNAKLLNYTVTTNNGTLTITRATLLVSADPKSRVYGSPNPTLTASVSGYVNGDSSASVSGTPNVTASADANSPVGTYPITVTLGSLSAANYDFHLSNGVLTIQSAGSNIQLGSSQNPAAAGADVTLTATVHSEPPSIGAPSGTVQFMVNGVAEGGPVTLVSGQASFQSQSLPSGTNVITATYSGDTNYSGSTVNLEQIIQPVVQAPGNLTIQMNANGTVTLSFIGTPNAQYLIQAINDLNNSNWTSIATQTADGTGHVTYTDLSAGGFSSRFYRAGKP